MNWESFGYTYKATQSGTPFKSGARARSVSQHMTDAVVVSVDGGYLIRTGRPMTHEEASIYIKRMESHPLRQYPRPSMGAREKPLCISRPDLFEKLNQARTILGLNGKPRR